MTWTNQLLSYRKVQIDYGDTLQAIALRELGDAGLWTQLADINNLAPPYIVNTLSEVTSTRVLLAGSSLLVPASATGQTGVSDDADILGTDFQLVDGMLTDDGAGDIATLSGLDNLRQALQHRLETKPKELIRHPTFGNRVFRLIGRMNGPVPLQLAAAWVAKCLSSDPRVSSVQDEDAEVAGDTTTVSAVVAPVQGKSLPVGATLKA